MHKLPSSTSHLLQLPIEIQFRIVHFLLYPWTIQTRMTDGSYGFRTRLFYDRALYMTYFNHYNTPALKRTCRHFYEMVTKLEKVRDRHGVGVGDFSGTLSIYEGLQDLLACANTETPFDRLSLSFKVHNGFACKFDDESMRSADITTSTAHFLRFVHTLEIRAPGEKTNLPVASDFACLPALRNIYVHTWSLWESRKQTITPACCITTEDCQRQLSRYGVLSNWKHLLLWFVELSAKYRVFNIHTVTHNHKEEYGRSINLNHSINDEHQLSHIFVSYILNLLLPKDEHKAS